MFAKAILEMNAGDEMDLLISQAYYPKFPVERYSENIVAAWEVVKALESAYVVEISTGNNYHKLPGMPYACKLSRTPGAPAVFFAVAPTVPLAICRAALLAVFSGQL